MGMEDPIPTFTEFATRVRDVYPNFAWLHIVEPRVNGYQSREVKPGESNDFLRGIWGSRPLIATGGFDREDAINTAEQRGGLIGFGRYFVANVRSPPFVALPALVEEHPVALTSIFIARPSPPLEEGYCTCRARYYQLL